MKTKTHFTELAIVTAVECLNEVYYDKIICNILISNLNLIDQHNIKISSALREKLSNFLSNYLKNFNAFAELENDDFTQILNLISILLEFQDFVGRSSTIEIFLPALLKSCNSTLRSVNVDDCPELEKLIKFFRLMETILKSLSKLEKNSKIYVVLHAIEDLLSEAFLIRNQSVLVYSFSLLSTYYEIVNCSQLIRKIWFNAVSNITKDRSYSEFYLIMISYLIGSSFGKKELSEIMNSDEFWNALQLCLEDEQCVQKHALHVLKYAVFNLCDSESCTLNHSNILNCAHLKDHDLWWKTYFIIMESFDEKQTHLVLPVFSLINNLINNENVAADTFWILRLLESGLKHDSRTVRIEALLFLLNVNVSSFNKRHIPYVVRIILTALNDSYMFRKAFKINKFEDLKRKFVQWIALFSGHECFKFFFENFYKMLIQMKWSPVPLFYTLSSVTECKDIPVLDSDLVSLSKSAILSITRSHNVKIRAAIQCLYIKFIITYSEKNNATSLAFVELLNYFNEEESLLRGTTSWQMIIEHLKTSTDYKSFRTFVCSRIDAEVNREELLSDNMASFLARCTVLLTDAYSLETYPNNILKQIDSFENVLHKAYANKKIQNNYLKFLAHLLKFERSEKDTRCPQNKLQKSINLSAQNFIYLCTYIVESMLICEQFEMIDFYENSLNEFTQLLANQEYLSFVQFSLLITWLEKASCGLKSEHDYIRYASLKVVLWIYRVIYEHPKIYKVEKLKNNLLVVMVDCMQNYKLKSPNTKRMIQSEGDGISGKAYSSFTDCFWSAMEFLVCFEKEDIFHHVRIQEIFTLVFEALDLARKENLIYIFRAIKVLFSFESVLKYEALVLRVVQVSWKLVQETTTTPNYADSLKFWIQTFCQEGLLRSPVYQHELLQYINELIKKAAEDGGQSYYFMILIVNQLNDKSNIFQVFPDVIEILINIFCITHISRKDQRIEYETINFIEGLGDSISVNQILKFECIDSAEEMRLRCLNVLLNVANEKTNKECIEIIKLLIASDDKCKKRYFNDSIFHRVKHKKLQLLLIFETILYMKKANSSVSEYAKELFHFAVNSLLTEPHQPSVRYLLEWLLIRVIIHFPDDLKKEFWNSFAEAIEERIGSICSFISVAYHLANILKEELFTEMAIKSILPWTMAQHFNARLYAQTVLVKLIEMNDEVAKKYEIIRRSLENSLKTGNAVKNAIKLQQDFYFSFFQPMEHFSLQTLLWDLPRLSNICSEEWIPVHLYRKYILKEYDGFSFSNKNDDFSSFSSSSWIAKATSVVHSDEKTFYEEKDQIANILQESQKKFIPQIDLLSSPLSTFPKNADNLIVVASLIDRAPNLGGLTRTCEIFAVSTLVVNNLEITRNKEFTSLSITAEKHVHIEEVKRYYLFSYLKKKKEESFAIIGLEQTTNSRNLSNFMFPKRSVLVLGNEKEGIPANLLPLLDTCVEIPQKGVIRSLNVHVSASLFIWEYAKQHLFDT